MKGILLAGGYGSRLFPTTLGISKHLIPIYDKPMIYYSLSLLMLSGIKTINIITTARDIENYKSLFSDGSILGLEIIYTVQETPRGIPDAILISMKFLGEDEFCLVLGDNLLYGQDFSRMLIKFSKLKRGAGVFAYPVSNARDYGVIELDSNLKVISLEEKPNFPKSNLIIPGIYFFDNKALGYAQSLLPSSRGELEILDLLEIYKRNSILEVQLLGRGLAWFDNGSVNSINQASNFVKAVQDSQGMMVACLEEIALNKGLIEIERVYAAIETLKNTNYGQYLIKLTDSVEKK